MPFKKGQSGNPKGKPKGAIGKKTQQWDLLADTLTGEQSTNFTELMSELWNGSKEDKLTAADLYIKMVEYFKPKMSRVDNQISGDLGINSIVFEDAKKSKD